MDFKKVIRGWKILGRDIQPLSGSPNHLLNYLNRKPQVDESGLQYLVAGGWGIELLTQHQRCHRDLDFLYFNTPDYPEEKGVDYYVLDGGYGYLNIDMPGEVAKKSHATSIFWQYGQREVYTPTPEFLLISKLTCLLGYLRPRDNIDVNSLLSTQNLDPEELMQVLQYADVSNHEELVSNIIQLSRYAKSATLEESHPIELGKIVRRAEQQITIA